MIRSIVRWSAAHPKIVLGAAAVFVVGAAAFSSALKFDALPDITSNQVNVLTGAPGLTPEEVERRVARPIESVLGGLPGLEQHRSVSRYGICSVTAVFEDGVDPYRARQLVQERLNTLVGVHAIDADHIRAAKCLGATRRDLLFDVIIPGALPQIFTGLQIAMGAAWFSLAAGEMIAAQYGLGFLIMDAYNLIQYPTIVIAMGTLGLMGFISSAVIRQTGDRLMRWRLEATGSAR